MCALPRALMVLEGAQGDLGGLVHNGGVRTVRRGEPAFAVRLHGFGKAGVVPEVVEEWFHVERRFAVWERLETGFHGVGCGFAGRQGGNERLAPSEAWCGSAKGAEGQSMTCGAAERNVR